MTLRRWEIGSGESKKHVHESTLTFGTRVLYLIQINHQPDATVFQFIILTFVYSSTCFGPCSWSGLQTRTRTQHDYHHDTKVKPKAATAVIELLMMGGKTLETC
jgi:hypothetical protein